MMRQHSAADVRRDTPSSLLAMRRTPICSPPIAAGSAMSGERCARTPSAAGTVTSTPLPITKTTGFAKATARPNTSGWPGLRPSTTRTTCSTSTPTSVRPDIGRPYLGGELLRREYPVALGHELTDLLPVRVVGEQHPDA